MRLVVLAVFTSTACGRLDFESRPDATPVDVSPDAAPRCDVTAPFTTLRRIDELATTNIDGAMRLAEDELACYFHRLVATDVQLYTATRTDRSQPFGGATLLMPTFGEWPTVTRDGRTLVYSKSSDGELYISTRSTTAQQFPTGSLLITLNTINPDASPTLSHDDTSIYYSVQAATEHFFVAPWPAAAQPTPLNELPSSTVIQAPTLSADELTIYYSQDDGSMNRTHILRATRSDRGQPFGLPQVVTELDGGRRDSPTWLSPDQCRLYIESDRIVAGDFDIYVAERSLN